MRAEKNHADRVPAGAVDALSRKKDFLVMEDHVCRHCFGRLVSHETDGYGGERRYVCTNCERSETGASPDVLCACGATVHRAGRPQSLGLRCRRNGTPTAEFPSVIVAGVAVVG